MSRTFVICFEPMRLLPASRRGELHHFWKFDYFNTVAHAAELMRWRQHMLDEEARKLSITRPDCRLEGERRFAQNVASIEHRVDLQIEEVIDMEFLYYHINEDLLDIGNFMQKLMPPGEISDMRLAFWHSRSCWYSGVVK